MNCKKITDLMTKLGIDDIYIYDSIVNNKRHIYSTDINLSIGDHPDYSYLLNKIVINVGGQILISSYFTNQLNFNEVVESALEYLTNRKKIND